MWFSRKKLLLLAICAIAYGCSNSQKASDSGDAESGIMADSQADSVGSIPEDLLATEEKGQTAENSESADPFSDLKEADKSEEAVAATTPDDAMSLLEGGEEKPEGSGNYETYTVKSGDTLMKIAFTIYGDIDRWKDLQDWNSAKIKRASALSKGMKLRYEAPVSPFQVEELAHSYTIKKGDTLANIADEVYGRKMKYKKLQNYNAKLIRNPNRIFAGFTIFYDITQKEIAEAEARRQERMAGGGSSGGSAESIPSAISPPPAENLAPPPPAPLAVAPSGEVPAPASMTDPMAPPPPPPPAN